jgi:hypothetical protein
VSAPLDTRSLYLDLRSGIARAPAVDVGDLAAVSARDREAALTNWRARMVSEHVSARVFAALVPQLMRAGLARKWVVEVSAMIDQELDHGLLCARVLSALGADAVAPMPEELPEVPRHADATPVECILRNVISISCCSETVAVALVGCEREQAGTPALRALLEQILRDEVRHARFGWRLLDELAPKLDARTRERLGEYLVAVFEHQIAFHAPFLEMGVADQPGVAIGAPDGESNWQIFVDTMTRITVPGLERQGLAAERAWTAATSINDA